MKKYLIVSSFAVLAFVSVAAAQEYSYSKDLTVGASGVEVSAIQKWLIDHGYDIPAISSGIATHGYFGEQTRLAVAAFQRAVGLPSFGYFGRLTRTQINNGQSSVHAPTITTVSGPTSLDVSQTGTWIIGATNAADETGNLSYSATWGDESLARQGMNAALPSMSLTFVQNTTFTHVYSSAGVYTVKFVVRNDKGFTATKVMTVNVGTTTVSSLKVTSPNGGETWTKGFTQNITWTAPAYFKATYADIKLIEYREPFNCPIGALCMKQAPLHEYPIAKSISINQSPFSWIVGNYIPEVMSMIYPPVYPTVPDGKYMVQVCEVNTTNCDNSDKYFTIKSNNSANKPPTISGVDAPTSLNVGQTGTWTVRATDPQRGQLNYSVDWGDTLSDVTSSCPAGYTCAPNSDSEIFPVRQTSTFTHSYSKEGTYTARFYVRNSAGLIAQTSVTVQVGTNITKSFLKVTSPNGGEVWPANSTHAISWVVQGGTNFQGTYDANIKVDLYLDRPNFYCITTPCPTMFVLDKNILINTQYNWIVATDINNAVIPAGDYKVRACIAGSTVDCDSSDATFTISSPLTQVCPTQKVSNVMPGVPNPSLPSTYYVYNNQRYELNQFDQTWVRNNCVVPEMVVS